MTAIESHPQAHAPPPPMLDGRMPLTGAAARSLRSLAHSLKPVVQIGKDGVTREVVAQVAGALLDHELIKVKLSTDDRAERNRLIGHIASRTASEVAQVIGKIVVLYKPHPKKPKIKVPKGYTAPNHPSRARDEDE